METINLKNDIKLFFVTAESFPEGIMDAHKKLHSLIPFSSDRKYFGISRPENGVMVYKAAAEETEPGELEKLIPESLFLKSGKYICITVNDFMKDIPDIGNVFQELLKNPGIDPEGYCVEWYINDSDVKCMVRII